MEYSNIPIISIAKLKSILKSIPIVTVIKLIGMDNNFGILRLINGLLKFELYSPNSLA